MGDYKKLEVWQLACEFSDQVEDLVDRLPPRVRRLTGDQLLRAAKSIHENIAEGCGLNSDRQLAKFARQALGSANECEDELLSLSRKNRIPTRYAGLLQTIRRICAMLASLIRRVESSLAGAKSPIRRPDGAEPLASSGD